jgi:hypothetical protein
MTSSFVFAGSLGIFGLPQFAHQIPCRLIVPHNPGQSRDPTQKNTQLSVITIKYFISRQSGVMGLALTNCSKMQQKKG